MEDDLKTSLIEEAIGENTVVKKVLVYEEIDSTNELLKREINILEDGTLAVALLQTAGKGSKGRSWTGSVGDGIWMSLLLFPEIPIHKAPMLTLITALSIARACKNLCGLDTQIKWPNDVVCNGKKICGILTEMKHLDNGSYGVVIGMGINVNTEGFSEDLRNKATSIFLETGKKWRRYELIGKVMECFSQDYQLFLQTSDLSLLLDAYRRISATIGKQVQIMDLRGSYAAKAINVDEEGYLLVECEDGRLKKIFGDEVSVRGIYGYV